MVGEVQGIIPEIVLIIQFEWSKKRQNDVHVTRVFQGTASHERRGGRGRKQQVTDGKAGKRRQKSERGRKCRWR